MVFFSIISVKKKQQQQQQQNKTKQNHKTKTKTKEFCIIKTRSTFNLRSIKGEVSVQIIVQHL